MAAHPASMPVTTPAPPRGVGHYERVWWFGILTLALFGWLAQTFIAWRPSTGDPWYGFLKSASTELLIFTVGIGLGLVWMGLGSVARWKLAGHSLVIAVLLLLAVLLFGVEVNGAKRWLSIMGYSFQPLEFAKLAVVLGFAWTFAPVREAELETLRDRAGYLLILLACMLLLVFVQPNISGTAILFSLMWLLAWPAGIRPLALIIIATLVMSAGLVYVKNDPERSRRLNSATGTVADHDLETKAESYQPDLAAFAIARGGLFGVGPGRSQVRHTLPASESDFIFAILVEEYGLIGGLLIIAVLAGAILYTLFLGSQIDNRFLQFIALGIALHWALQILLHLQVNLGGVTTGVPLPFFSKGGSAGLVIGMEVALIALVARMADRQPHFAPSSARTGVRPTPAPVPVQGS